MWVRSRPRKMLKSYWLLGWFHNWYKNSKRSWEPRRTGKCSWNQSYNTKNKQSWSSARYKTAVRKVLSHAARWQHLRRKRKLYYWSEICWSSFSGIQKVNYSEKTKWSAGSLAPNLWAGSWPNCRKHDPIWRRRKCTYIMRTNRSHRRHRHGHIGRIRLRTSAISTVFYWFFLAAKLEKVLSRTEIWAEG